MGLELGKVLEIELSFFILLLGLEDDDPSSLIPQGYHLPLRVKFNRSDDVILQDFLIWPLVAKNLAVLILATFAYLILHPQ